MIGIFALILVSIISFYAFLSKRNRSRYHQFQGPPDYPIIGSASVLIGKSPLEIFDTLTLWHQKYGPNFQIRAPLSIRQPIISDADDVAAVLTSQKIHVKSFQYDFLRDWLGDGLLMSIAEKWHARRKIITPTFHYKILEDFCEVFDKQSSIMVKCLEKHVDQDFFNVFPFVANCSLDVICETAMGVTVNAQNDPESLYVKNLHELGKILFQRCFNPMLQPNFIYKLTKLYKTEKEALKVMHGFTDKVINSKREELKLEKAKPEESQETDYYGIKKRVALLDLLLKYSDEYGTLNDADIREEVDTFMFEGQDTTTSGIAFALYNLAKYPEIQEKCFEECVSVLGGDLKEPSTQKQLNDLQYLDLVIKESLRIYPSVPIIGRRITEDTEINGKLLEKGTELNLYLFGMFRSPKYFENPEKFWPERFEGVKDNKSMNPFSYVPFSAGSRNCIGQKFAMLEMKSTVSKVIRQFKLFADPAQAEIGVFSDLILKPVNGISLKITKRTEKS